MTSARSQDPTPATLFAIGGLTPRTPPSLLVGEKDVAVAGGAERGVFGHVIRELIPMLETRDGVTTLLWVAGPALAVLVANLRPGRIVATAERLVVREHPVERAAKFH